MFVCVVTLGVCRSVTVAPSARLFVSSIISKLHSVLATTRELGSDGVTRVDLCFYPFIVTPKVRGKKRRNIIDDQESNIFHPVWKHNQFYTSTNLG